MIERFYLKNHLTFDEVELYPIKGLVVFSGPSGSGKSLLLDSILSSFGKFSCDAFVCESTTTWNINESFGINNEESNIFKHTKKEKVRYFLNSQSISKKIIQEISSNFLKHLSLKDYSDFENENLILILDNRIDRKNKNFSKLKKKYKEVFKEYKELREELQRVQDEEQKIAELKEFAAFEIKKIEDVSPKISEDEELTQIKKELSKKEKVLEKISQASVVFEYEHLVTSALETLDFDGSFFDDTMNELRVVFDNAQAKYDALDDVDIEYVLNRIEELGNLKRRYGSIEEALAYKEKKLKELEKYENIYTTKEELLKKESELLKKRAELAENITKAREAEITYFMKDLNNYLKELYLRDAQVFLQENEYTPYGKDKIVLKLDSTPLDKISTGEFNRLRLAILALKSEFMSKSGAVLMLDEIDANLSGEESMSVAKVLRKLSKYFQIFVISHQPQLTSMGEQHFLVYKEDGVSKVKELDFDERVKEIARIISGEDISNEAKKFAKELLETNR